MRAARCEHAAGHYRTREAQEEFVFNVRGLVTDDKSLLRHAIMTNMMRSLTFERKMQEAVDMAENLRLSLILP